MSILISIEKLLSGNFVEGTEDCNPKTIMRTNCDFDTGTIRNRRYRNRRIGEFLKELNLTEGRGTGIPTMKRVLNINGSPKPIFKSDQVGIY